MKDGAVASHTVKQPLLLVQRASAAARRSQPVCKAALLERYARADGTRLPVHTCLLSLKKQHSFANVSSFLARNPTAVGRCRVVLAVFISARSA